jgi:uncharacterized repeat protein (TIGR01451 family)
MKPAVSAAGSRGRASFARLVSALIVSVALSWGATAAQAPIDKDATYSEMIALALQMRDLKPQVRLNLQAQAAYSVAEARYRELQALMGGDDPGQMLEGQAAASSRPMKAKAVPATPAGCSPTTTTFTQAAPTAVPTGPGVVTSTVAVSGAGPYLFDLDVTTFLRHTFAADLDVTITSPAGTVVTLTTDNGAGNDDVFNGTVWDDDANPAGQVPYTTNAGLVTDHPYVNLTLASPLVPEEALAAFIGEDPNGTWTLTISDDLAGDGGSLDSWSLAVTTFPSAPITTVVPTVTQSTPVAIPTGPAVVTSTLLVSGAGTSILDANVTTFITHTFAADLDVTITSPAGTVVTLTTDNGAGNDDVFNGTVWDDDANPAGQVPYTTNNGLVTDHAYVNLTLASPLVPEEALGAFIGEDPNGTWTLTISDDLAGDGGSLDSWSLDLVTFTCDSADLSITKTDGVASATPGGVTTWTITAANAGPSAASPASVTDTFPAACSAVSYTSVAAGGATGNTAAGAGGISDLALSLPAGSSVTYTATCTIDPAAAGTLENTATVSSPVFDPVPGNNSATDIDTLTASADLSMSKTLATAGVISVGSNIVFALSVTNAGPSDATGVTVTDTLPAGLLYISNDCGAAFASPTLTWNVGSLAASTSASCNLTVRVAQEGAIANTATATANEGDPSTADNTSQATFTAAASVQVPTLGGAGSIAPGTRLGPYEITAKLGAGGMGEVWKAKDFQLGREVALKVLPEGFTADPERLARFEREAKLLAQLNHPNIAQVYGFETAADGSRALVMELVDGPTLAERLETGSLPFSESLSVALQIAHALEEAHEKGIVHRDLKPQNVKASIEGKVKVLDFGLAKAIEASGGASTASQLAHSPTITFGATVEGVILGTAAYMAPEQAAGKAVDKRADIWAFGVVLWEMLAGRTLFAAESVPETLAAVLRADIDLAALPAETPPAIRRLLRRCLERQPRARLRDIGDARMVLEEVLSGRFDEAGSAPSTPSRPASCPPPRTPITPSGRPTRGRSGSSARAI